MLKARLHLRQGDVNAAARWAERVQMSWDEKSDELREPLHLTYARLLIAKGSLDEAQDLLAKLETQVQAGERDARLISVRILQAVSEAALDHEKSARQFLSEAIQLAAPEGYIRRFVDEGATVAGLLPSVRSVVPAFVDQLRQAFGDVSASVSGTSASVSASPQPTLIKPLTRQQLNVLRLLAEGLTYKAIAERLVISLGTARWHIHNIYVKLDVSNRTQGISRARELGLL